MTITTVQTLDLSGKTVLIREDLNVPISDGKITNDARLQASLPTIQMALDKGAKTVLVCSHLGRPTEGEYDDKFSLQPVAHYLSERLNQPVSLCKDYLDGLPQDSNDDVNQVILLENVRFNEGEKKNSEMLSNQYADLADVFVMDAFGTAHRAQASTEGVIRAMKKVGKPVCAGPLLAGELDALDKALKNPQKPMVAIVGGSKVSTKLDVLTSLAKICDQIIVGGGIANTFLAAKGYNVGASLCEKDMIETAKSIMTQTTVILPTQVVVANKDDIDFEDFIGSLKQATAIERAVDDVQDNEMILDVAEAGMKEVVKVIGDAKTILWNGPLGVFEVPAFESGTKKLSNAIASSQAFSIAGGGDTLSAIHQFAVADSVSYLSTGGGAFLEFVEGKPLPAVIALEI